MHRLLCQGFTDVVDADLSKCFDTIPHDKLLGSIAARSVDRHALRLIKMWLKVSISVECFPGNGNFCMLFHSLARLDLQLDGMRIAQRRPGMAVVLPIPPGAHVLTMQVWLRRLGTGEMINALPGTDTDIRSAAAGADHGSTASSGGTWLLC